MAEVTADVQLDQLELKDRLLKTSVTKMQLIRLAMKGLNATEAAKVVGIHEQTARSHYADPEFRRAVLSKVDAAFAGVDAAFTEKRKTLHELLEEQAYKSCINLMAMLENDELHPSLKVKINQDFLNRVEDTAQFSRQAMKMDPADLQHAAKVAAEMDKVVEIRRKA